MRMRLGTSLAVALVVAAASPASGQAAGAMGQCTVYGDQTICSGTLPASDGSPLDFDLTKPTAGTGPHPLIVLLHGFGNNKHEWESTSDEGDGFDKARWNSHWFAEHGYYVLTYTARGFRDFGPDRPDQPATPSFTSEAGAPGQGGVIRLKSREWEVQDTQYLASLVVKAFPDIDPRAIAVSGGSYGGGESWLQAADQKGWNALGMRLQVAVPKYGWTDLAYSLAPNGHGGGPSGQDIYESSTNLPYTRPAGQNPFGVPKASYISYFSADGAAHGTFQNATHTYRSEGPIDINAWLAATLAGPDPYSDPILAQQIRRGLTEYRGGYYQDAGWTYEKSTDQEVAVFSVQGWTDDLFPAVESFRQFKYLKRIDARWPVSVALADVGHPRALQANAPAWHRLNAQAWQFLQSNIGGSHQQQTTISSEPTVCPGQPDAAAARRVTASTPEDLAHGTSTVGMPGGLETNLSGQADAANSTSVDPITGVVEGQGPCRRSAGPPAGAYSATTTAPLPRPLDYDDLGTVTLSGFAWTGTTATLVVRLWDVAPDGTTLLADRGAYRLQAPSDTAVKEVRIPLYGDHWLFESGHRIRVDILQTDAPTYLPSKQVSTTSWSGATLTLPTREASSLTLAAA